MVDLYEAVTKAVARIGELGVAPQAQHARRVKGLEWADVDEGRAVALVTENLVRELWGEPRAALGKRIRWEASGPWQEIVGVTQNVYGSVYQPPPRGMYGPIRPSRNGLRTTTYVVRSERAGSESFANEIRHYGHRARNIAQQTTQLLLDAHRKLLAPRQRTAAFGC